MTQAPAHPKPGKKRCQHLTYYLDCDEYDLLVQRAGGKCELCGCPAPVLYIDHDHSVGNGLDGVRGLVCPRCNAHMRRVDAGEYPVSEECARYLADPWWRHLPEGHMHCVAIEGPTESEPLYWWMRSPDRVWKQADTRVRAEGRHILEVIAGYLARYGAAPPADAPTADPWTVVNLVMREVAGGAVGPSTDLSSAADAAADMLRALGIQPLSKSRSDA